MSHENGNTLPRNEYTSEKASTQINFEVTQLKFIRYDSTFFVHRMYPSYYLPSYYAPCLRSKISVKHFKTDSLSSSDLAESTVEQSVSCPFLDFGQPFTLSAIRFWTLMNRLTFKANRLFFCFTV